MTKKLCCASLILLTGLFGWQNRVAAADDDQTLKLGPVTIVVPKDWTRKKLTSTIIAHEFAAPAAKDDKADGRFTVSSAGGSVEQNIDRWYGQFTQEDGGDTKKRGKTEKKRIAGHTVHFVEASGTYRDLRPSTSPQKDYRLLGAIIETDDGNIFLKFVGPKRTIGEHEKAFRKMAEELKTK